MKQTGYRTFREDPFLHGIGICCFVTPVPGAYGEGIHGGGLFGDFLRRLTPKPMLVFCHHKLGKPTGVTLQLTSDLPAQLMHF